VRVRHTPRALPIADFNAHCDTQATSTNCRMHPFQESPNFVAGGLSTRDHQTQDEAGMFARWGQNLRDSPASLPDRALFARAPRAKGEGPDEK
jgi:hypothetical protein